MVLITEYMDPTHDRNGQFPNYGQCSAPAFDPITNAEWAYFHDSIVHPINQKVDSFPDIAQAMGFPGQVYAVTGIEQDFLTHGICAGDQRWVFDIADSTNLLGSDPHTDKYKTNGTGHPIAATYKPALGLASDPCCGQEDYRDRIYNMIVEKSYPVTTASATADGAAYTFGTWTNQDVTVTLSATNAIKESGVKQTLYAVDDTADCQPVTWPRCSVYGGPFTIGTSGKHTVTFDSQNNAGFMWSFQNVQVWVDKNPPVSGMPAFQSVPKGGTASYTITLGHVGWTGQTINLSCATDLPLAQCTVQPASVTLDATNSNTSVATVVTSLSQAVLLPATGTRPNPYYSLAALRLLLALATVAFLLAMVRFLRARRWVPLTQFAGLALLCGSLCAGCNSAAQPLAPRSPNTVTITATDGTTTNTIQVSLLVQ